MVLELVEGKQVLVEGTLELAEDILELELGSMSEPVLELGNTLELELGST